MSELSTFMSYWIVLAIIIGCLYIIPLLLFYRWDTKLKKIEKGVYEPDKEVLDQLITLNGIMNEKIIGTNEKGDKQ